ncbi:MAG: RidA family protein [Candidatus Eiseniibacteriota bacterium]
MTAADSALSIRSVAPADLYDTRAAGFAQVVVAGGGRLAVLSGMVAYDTGRNLIGAGDHAAQLRQALRNVTAALAGVGATVENVILLRIYIVGYDVAQLPMLHEALREAFGAHHAANTLVGVAALARPGLLVEVEAMAMIA